MKIKLQNFSKSKQLLLLDVLDFLVDKGNMNIWSAISSKKFFQGLLDLLRTKDIPEVQMKLLGLIQKWGLNFEDKKNALPNFFSVYNKLRMNNVQFPSNFESNYQAYFDENNINKNNYEKNSENDNDNEDNNNGSDKEDDEIFYYMDSLKNVLKVPNFEHKYRRLVNFLLKMHDNIQMANLLIDNREHGGLKEIINTLREGNNTLIDTIQGGRLKDEKLMEITLGTTEDINQTLGRDEDIKNGYKPNKFKSYFVVNNVIKIKSHNSHNKHINRAKSTKPKKNIQRNQEKYGIENNLYDKNKYKQKMGPKNADDIFDLFSASNPNNEPQYNQNNNNNRGNNNYNTNNINNFFNSPQTQQLRNNPMNNFFNNNNRNNNNMNMNNMNNNNRNNNTMFFNQNNNQYNNQQRPVMTNFDILEQKLNNLNIEQNQNNNYNTYNPNQNMPNMQFNQGFNNNNNNNINNNNNRNNNNLMSMLDQLGPGPETNSNQLVPYIGSFNNNQNNNNNNMNQNNFMNNNNNQFNNNMNNNMNQNNFMNNNNNNQFNNNRNMFQSQVINRGNNMNINTTNNNQMNMNRMNMSQNMGNNNNWMNQNNNNNNNFNQNNQQMNFEEMQKQQRLKELDDLF